MKAQGLPLNTIVLGALAVLVLVLLAAAFVPGVGSMFSSIFGATPSSESAFATNCINYCSILTQIASGQSTSAATSTIRTSDYCLQTLSVEGGGVNYCYDFTDCEVTASTGNQTGKIDSTWCQGTGVWTQP